MKVSEEKFNECFVPKLKESDAADNMMQFRLFMRSSTLTAEEKIKIGQYHKAEGMLVPKVVKACDEIPNFVDSFGRDMYDDFYFYTSNKSEEKLYCIRKYVIGKNLINTSLYNITLNPTNLNTTIFNCDEVFNINAEMKIAMPTKTEQVKSDDFSNCFHDKWHTLAHYEQKLKRLVLEDVNLSVEEGKSERENYSEFVRKMNLGECFELLI